MKLTRILPKSIAIVWQEHHLMKLESMLEYHRNLVNNLEYAVNEAQMELDRLDHETR